MEDLIVELEICDGSLVTCVFTFDLLEATGLVDPQSPYSAPHLQEAPVVSDVLW